MPTDTEVIIIGAGAAGLAAARELGRLGRSAVLIESLHRIGGRAYSEELAPGTWFDLGCSYLHNGDINPFTEIAESLNVPIGREFGDIFKPDKSFVYRAGAPLTVDERRQFFSFWEACDQLVYRPREPADDVAIADLIDLDHAHAPTYANLMAGMLAQDADLISAADAAAFKPGPDYPVRDGYGNLVAAWGADVPVQLNCRAERIDWSGREVVVSTSRGALQARSVLCTVSTGILASGHLAFSPELPSWKREAIEGLPMGTLNKVGLHFDQDIFGPDGRGFYYLSRDEPGAIGFEASVTGDNVAVVFSGGRHAVWLEQQGPRAGQAYALDQVAGVFGNDVRRRVTRSIVTAWSTEPATLGAYSCALPGQAQQREVLAKSLDDRLFFAGEATRIEDHACCHGAYWSGIRAAGEIDRRLSPAD